MRKLTVIFGLMLTYLGALAQDTSFVKLYGGLENETSADLLQIGDFLYLVGNYGSGGQGLTDLYLVKTDTMGNRKWTRTYGTSAVEQATAAVALGDTALIIVGYTNSTFANTYDGLLTCVDTAGNELWSRTVGGTDWDFLYDVTIDANGDVVAVGETFSTGAGLSDGYMVKLTNQGTLIYERVYGGPKKDLIRTIALLNTDQYVLGGTFESGAVDSTDIAIIRTDLNGSTLHTAYHGGAGQDVVNKVLVSATKDLLIAGASSILGAGQLDFLLMKTDTMGNVFWRDQFGGPDNEQWRDVRINQFGTALVTGHSYSQIGGGKEEVFSYRYALAGFSEYLTTFGGFENDFGQSIIPHFHENVALISGTTNSFGCGNNDIFFSRSLFSGQINTNAMVSFCDTTGVVADLNDQFKDTQFQILRSNYGFDVIVPSDQLPLTMELFDLTGRMLIEKQITSSFSVLAVPNSMAPVIYRLGNKKQQCSGILPPNAE